MNPNQLLTGEIHIAVLELIAVQQATSQKRLSLLNKCIGIVIDSFPQGAQALHGVKAILEEDQQLGECVLAEQENLTQQILAIKTELNAVLETESLEGGSR